MLKQSERDNYARQTHHLIKSKVRETYELAPVDAIDQEYEVLSLPRGNFQEHQPKKIYVSFKPEYIEYTLLDPQGNLQQGQVKVDLKANGIDEMEGNFRSPFTLEKLQQDKAKSALLWAISKHGHILRNVPNAVCEVLIAPPITDLVRERLLPHQVSFIVDELIKNCQQEIGNHIQEPTADTQTSLLESLQLNCHKLILPYFLKDAVHNYTLPLFKTWEELEDKADPNSLDEKIDVTKNLAEDLEMEIFDVINKEILNQQYGENYHEDWLPWGKLATNHLLNDLEVYLNSNPASRPTLEELKAWVKNNAPDIVTKIKTIITTNHNELAAQLEKIQIANDNDVPPKTVQLVQEENDWPQENTTTNLQVKILENPKKLLCSFMHNYERIEIEITPEELLKYNDILKSHKDYQFKQIVILKPETIVDPESPTSYTTNTLIVQPVKEGNVQKYRLYIPKADGKLETICRNLNLSAEIKKNHKKILNKGGTSSNVVLINGIVGSSNPKPKTSLQKNLAIEWPENQPGLVNALPWLCTILSKNGYQAWGNSPEQELQKLIRAFNFLKLSIDPGIQPSVLNIDPKVGINPYESNEKFKNLLTPKMHYSVLRDKVAHAKLSFNLRHPLQNFRFNQQIDKILTQFPAVPNQQDQLKAYQDLCELKILEAKHEKSLEEPYCTPVQRFENYKKAIEGVMASPPPSFRLFNYFYGEKYQAFITELREIYNVMLQQQPSFDPKEPNAVLDTDPAFLYAETLAKLETLQNKHFPAIYNPFKSSARKKLMAHIDKQLGAFKPLPRHENLAKIHLSEETKAIVESKEKEEKNIRSSHEGNNYSHLAERDILRNQDNPQPDRNYSALKKQKATIAGGTYASLSNEEIKKAENEEKDLKHVKSTWNGEHKNFPPIDADEEKEYCEKPGLYGIKDSKLKPHHKTEILDRKTKALVMGPQLYNMNSIDDNRIEVAFNDTLEKSEQIEINAEIGAVEPPAILKKSKDPSSFLLKNEEIRDTKKHLTKLEENIKLLFIQAGKINAIEKPVNVEDENEIAPEIQLTPYEEYLKDTAVLLKSFSELLTCEENLRANKQTEVNFKELVAEIKKQVINLKNVNLDNLHGDQLNRFNNLNCERENLEKLLPRLERCERKRTYQKSNLFTFWNNGNEITDDKLRKVSFDENARVRTIGKKEALEGETKTLKAYPASSGFDENSIIINNSNPLRM